MNELSLCFNPTGSKTSREGWIAGTAVPTASAHLLKTEQFVTGVWDEGQVIFCWKYPPCRTSKLSFKQKLREAGANSSPQSTINAHLVARGRRPRQGLIEAVLCTWHMYTASAAQRVHIYLYISYREVFIYLWHVGWGADRLSSHRGGVWNATRILSIISLEILASPGEPAADQLCITVYH